MKNASLVWRKFEKRYDYTVRGYEIFLVNGYGSNLSRANLTPRVGEKQASR